MKSTIVLWALKKILGYLKKRPALIDKIDSVIPGQLDDDLIQFVLENLG